MRRDADDARLTARDRAILKDVILNYIFHAEPVSSRAVAKHGVHGLSAASIRNVMADLEEAGFLSQPHSSAGRVPTPKAYHLYIESMMDDSAVLPADERRYIDSNLQAESGAEELVASASQLLSQLSHQVGVVLTPAVGETVLKTVDFVSLSERKVLCVVVSTSGFVDNKVILTQESVPREELVRISNYVTATFAGQTLLQARDLLLRRMAEERAQVDHLLARTIELVQAGLDLPNRQGLLLEGTREILHQPEMADLDRVRRLFETFADKARLVMLLSQLMEGPGVRVVIGEDSDLTSPLDFSLVTKTYGAGDRPLGTLGILGPSRMAYQRIIPLVDYLGERLSQALADTFGAEA